MNDSVEWYGDYTYPMLFLVFCAVIHISRYKLINYISLSLSTSSLVLFLSFFFLSFVFIWFYPTFPPSSAYSPLPLPTPITPNADSNPLSRLPIPRHLRASNHSRLDPVISCSNWRGRWKVPVREILTRGDGPSSFIIFISEQHLPPRSR